MANVLIANHNPFNLLKNSSDISDAFFPPNEIVCNDLCLINFYLIIMAIIFLYYIFLNMANISTLPPGYFQHFKWQIMNNEYKIFKPYNN